MRHLPTITRLLLLLVLVASTLSGPTTAGASGPDAAAPFPLTGDQHRFALTGSRAGSFAYYAFDYDGSDRTATVNLDVWPEDKAAFDGGLVGFRVYDARGTLALTGGAQPGLVPNVSGDLRGRERGRYLVQVY